MTSFNLSSFDLPKDSDKQVGDLLMLARVAEHAERYDDMCTIMKALLAKKREDQSTLSEEERNLLSVAYKNVIGCRRAAFRTMSTDGQEDLASKEKKLLNVYRDAIINELREICAEVLDLLGREKDGLVATAEDSETRVFYLKMAGDYHRYMAEVFGDKEPQHCKGAGDMYEQAMQIAQGDLEATHPIRLGLALNYSVCHYEILMDKQKACDLAKKAFDEAINGLDKLDESSYKDSTLIMQLLRDNLTLWNSSMNDEDLQEHDYDDE